MLRLTLNAGTKVMKSTIWGVFSKLWPLLATDPLTAPNIQGYQNTHVLKHGIQKKIDAAISLSGHLCYIRSGFKNVGPGGLM